MQVAIKLERIEGMKFNVKLPDGRGVELNSSKQIGQAFSPMELFLVALAGCTAMDVQWIMDRQRQKVHKLEISARGTRREDDPRYYETIDLEYTLSGLKIRKDAVERAIRLSQEKYCSVRAMIKDSVKINISYKVTDGLGPAQEYTYTMSATPES